MMNKHLQALHCIVSALDEVDANQGLPPPDQEGEEIPITSFKKLVMQCAENTGLTEEIIDEILEKPLGTLADELIGK